MANSNPWIMNSRAVFNTINITLFAFNFARLLDNLVEPWEGIQLCQAAGRNLVEVWEDIHVRSHSNALAKNSSTAILYPIVRSGHRRSQPLTLQLGRPMTRTDNRFTVRAAEPSEESEITNLPLPYVDI